ncbi:addiction module toxin RelE, partial [Yersinia pestis]
KSQHGSPKSLALQQGSKRMSPDELTSVSDSGE